MQGAERNEESCRLLLSFCMFWKVFRYSARVERYTESDTLTMRQKLNLIPSPIELISILESL